MFKSESFSPAFSPFKKANKSHMILVLFFISIKLKKIDILFSLYSSSTLKQVSEIDNKKIAKFLLFRICYTKFFYNCLFYTFSLIGLIDFLFGLLDELFCFNFGIEEPFELFPLIISSIVSRSGL